MDIEKIGGGGLLKVFHGEESELIAMLKSLYPDKEWIDWKFEGKPYTWLRKL